MSISSGSSASPTSSLGPKIPRVGAIRCYWALLTPRYTPLPANSDGTMSTGSKLELKFVHPDPMLGYHLSKQKLSMMGRSVIEFIHPAEREQARKDLTSAISADDLQGSVTRVRFARLSRIRTILGCPPEENEFPIDADKFAEDDEYLILDLVLNWVADGLLLAFFHAIKDKDPVANNDPRLLDAEWSNWCGTKVMPEEQIEALHRNISEKIPSSPSSNYPPSRVFQLHYSTPSLEPSAPPAPPQLIFSWPPPRPIGVKVTPDGQYTAAEYCELMKGVDMDPSQLNAGPGELRTNCTTRYGAQHSITTEGVYRHVTSVFIPYGNLIFACFQTTRMYELPAARNNGTSSASTYHENDGHLDGEPSLGNDWNSSLSSIGSNAGALAHAQPVQPFPTSQPTIQTTAAWAHSDPLALPPRQDTQWDSGPSTGYQTSIPSTSHSSYITPPHPAAPYNQTQFHAHHHSHYTNHLQSSIPLSASMNSGHLSNGHSPPSMSNGHPMSNGGGGSNGSSSSRPLVRPPGNVVCCVMCGIRESPEWRRNESGIKDLCNACGLRLARQVAKREGRQKPRKKKDSTGNSVRGDNSIKDQYGI
ncbi:uncharacterized protein I303_106012 [Kwoniella dejecticola CBS 10117]|uniref:GATA-type domain-containing protein n=1 Tax=Kwoniella dejecticola CBS 10117 TaxID=1296121 RepID=A0A1A6A113_9TREE|nr:uncharacterized protein I303_06032 [Kwoniella dejecticola CBS 10117]OBR83751.1 hypothetical protein I303_06032 [Kwoniella dejecticola CBS 10117]